MRIFAELSESGKNIDVHFPYNPEAVAAIKRMPNRKFVDKHHGGPLWRLPLDLVTGTRLREEFGNGLVLGDALKQWGRDEVSKQRNLRSLARATDAELVNLPRVHPKLFEYVSKRPYQRADIKLMAEANVGNFNQPGTGKTIETIASWIESGLWDQGPHLVIAPVRSLENVWFEELEWLDLDVYTSEDPAVRRQEIAEGLERAERGEPVVLCINADMIRVEKIWDAKKSKGDPPPKSEEACRDYKGNIYGFRDELSERLCKVHYKTFTIDEGHKTGMPNRNSLFSNTIRLIRADRRAVLTGTPIGGVTRKLWAYLNWLEPDEYGSEWAWINNWLETEDGFGKSKIVNDIQPGREDAFYEAHARHMVRRLKREALPGLPPQVHVTVKCSMTNLQKAQYAKFHADAEIRIDEERLTATGVLAEYARLKQFANAKQELIDGVPFPTTDSGKLLMLMEKLDEEGIRKLAPEPGARAIIASESSRMIEMVADYLTEQGFEVGLMTGKVKDTRPVIKRFKSKKKEPYIICMTTQTGGVSLNLQEADSIHALDETWNPDDLEQLFDRGDRGSRTTPLRCYTYRTKDTIQEYIAEVNEGKKVTNKNVMDLRRQMFKE